MSGSEGRPAGPRVPWREDLLAFRRRFTHPAWGVAHSERVYALALELFEAESGREGARAQRLDREALFVAAHLHDLGAFPPYRQAGVDHAARSVQAAPGILAGLGFPAEGIPLVCEIIAGHMFDAEPGPSREAVLFHDADTLDFLGAIGVTRVLSIVGQDDWAPDLRHAVDLLRRFSRDLPERLHTPLAQEVGRRRQAEMDAFLSALAGETGGLQHLQDDLVGERLRVTAAVVRRRDGRVLLAQRRAGSHLAGHWEFPGGKVEPGETPAEALRRELAEELGVEVRVGGLFTEVAHDYPEKSILLQAYLCDLLTGEPEPLECAAVRWVGVDELAAYRLAPADIPVAERLRAERARP